MAVASRILKPIPFTHNPRPTLGVEIEVQVVDPRTHNLAAGSLDILERFGESPHLKQELTQSTVEVITGVCADVDEVEQDLRATFEKLYEVGDDLGFLYAAAGTHPFAQWREQKIYPNERYQDLVDRVQWPARRLLIYGLHVHVGLQSGEKAIAICNGLTAYIPHLLALSSSSPFIDFEDTGLASTRAKIFEAMPTAGLPFRLNNYSEFQMFMNSLLNANAIFSIREIWWDIRPHPGFGTLEIRICDCPSTLWELLALTALVQCLVVWLDHCYDNGAMPELLNPWIVRENKWRACRWGMDASVIVDNKGTQVKLGDAVPDLVNRLSGVAEDLGCARHLAGINRILEEGASYQRQRKLYERTHSFRDVVQDLSVQLRESFS
ncbi:MAG: glutamate--cysteine ligase [Bacteroidota bacterium]